MLSRRKRMKRTARLQSASSWLSTYTGNRPIPAYRKRFGVDLMCAIIELQMLGVSLDSEYVQRLRQSEKGRLAARQKSKMQRQAALEMSAWPHSDMYHAVIIGHTSGGFAYGLTWEQSEMEDSWLEDPPREVSEMDDDLLFVAADDSNH